MIIFYSGDSPRAQPEMVLLDEACVMLSYAYYAGKTTVDTRFSDIEKARKKGRTIKCGLPPRKPLESLIPKKRKRRDWKPPQ